MTKAKVTKKKKAKNEVFVFDKYELYRKAVQSAENDVEFIRDTFRKLKGRDPFVFREDFCGTFALSTEWVKLNEEHESIGVDLDPEPMEYGKLHYLTTLNASQQDRMTLINGNVLDPKLPKADIVCAMNFSYFCFKTREMMKQYFANVYRTLEKDGMFMVDLFGGSQCYDAIEDEIVHDGFTYYWDQTGFDPISNEAVFHIHFKIKGKKVENVFTYDWRMWSIPEIRDIMNEVGFKKTHVYWEGTAPDGSGNGEFTPAKVGEACQSWIAYVIAEK